MRKFFAGMGAFIAFAAILVGIPIALIDVAGNPLPTAAEWHNIVTLTPDYGNVILLTKVLPLIGWIAWLVFAVPFLIEVGAAIFGRTTRKRSWAFRGQQQLAATLIAVIAVMFAGGLGLTGAAPAHAEEIHATSTSTAAATPAPPQTQTVTKVQDVHVTVEEGDTLWGIAQRSLGNGEDYGQIFAASTGTVQPDGQQMTDPNLIQPGWEVTVPETVTVTVTVTEPVTPAPTPAPASPSSGAAARSTSNPHADAPPVAGNSKADQGGSASGSIKAVAPGRIQTSAPTQQPDHKVDTIMTNHLPASGDGSDLSVPLTTGGGVASILAAGLLAALGVRRLGQRRRRKLGERIAMPEGEVANEELELCMVEDPLGVREVDNALRALQAWALLTETRLPEIFALRLEESREIALYFNEPADLPEPFEPASQDRTAWIVRPGRAKEPPYPVGSPYPALTTIGTDAHSGILMLDLEQIGSLTITGDTGLALGVLNALATELAVNPWSEQIQVTLVGMPDYLADKANAYRVHQVQDLELLIRNIRADLQQRRAAFDSYGVTDIYEARTRAADSESWPPHVIILGQTPSDEVRQQLAELVAEVPRLGVATVGHSPDAAAGGSTLQISSRDHAEFISAIPGAPALPLRPQILVGQELTNIQHLFRKTRENARPAPVVAEPENVPVTPSPAESASNTTAETDTVDITQDAPAEAMAASTPIGQATTAPPAVTGEVLTPATASKTVPAPTPQQQLPYVRILGPIEAENLPETGKMPGRGLELLAYLSLHGPVTGPQLQQAFWPGKPHKNAINNQKGLVGPVRDFLGNAPDGARWLPENVLQEGFSTHGALRTDWHEFRQLIGPDLSCTTNENLVAAVRLVRGVPFQAANTTRGWWDWIVLDQQDMVAAILDAADELGRRALAADDTIRAAYAGRVAQTVDLLNGQGWRTEMRAAWKRRDIDDFLSIVERNVAAIELADPDDDLDDETQQLVAAARADMGV